MFKCQNQKCGKTVSRCQPQNRVIVETRPQEYQKPIIKNRKTVGYETIFGSEIVKEIACCPECYQEHTGLEPLRFIPREAPSRQLNSKPVRPGKKKRWENPRRGKGHKGKKDHQGEKRRPKVEVVNPVKE